MPTKCTITGTVVSPDGTPIANASVLFVSAVVRSMTPLSIAPEITQAKTNDAGLLLGLDGGAFDIYPGRYDVRVTTAGRQTYGTFKVQVPEAALAVLADIQDLPPVPTLDNAALALAGAQAARDVAVQAAADAEAAVGEAGTGGATATAQAVIATQAAVLAAEDALAAAESAAAALASKNAVDLGALNTAVTTSAASATAAAGSAGTAGTAATTATTQASAATTAKTAAETAKAVAETARDATVAAAISAGTYASTAAGLAAVVEGAKFWALSGTDTIQQYTKTGGVAVAVAGVSLGTAAVAGILPQNLRISRQTQTEKFRAGDVTGSFNWSTGAIFPTPTWSIDANGALDFAADQSGTVFRFWDIGRTWEGVDPIEVTTSGVWTSLANTTGPCVHLGDVGSAGAVRFMYANNGSLGVYDNAGSAMAGKGGSAVYANIAFATNETVTLRVVIYPDGAGFMEGTDAAGDKATHQFSLITERGLIGPGARRAAAGKITRFRTRVIDTRVPALQESTDALEDRVTTLETGLIPASALKPLSQLFGTATLNHILMYGQSNSIGADAIEPISLSQPYANVTFAGGPRAWAAGAWSYSPLKPLAEDRDDTGGSGSSSVPMGESPSTGAANYATTCMALRGVNPASHVILASTAGRGSYRLNQLEKGTSWYNSALKPMVAAAKAINSAYACHAVCYVQGERDADEATAYATYKPKLVALQVDLETDIKAISGQSGPVYLLLAQMTKYATTSDAVARAQFDATQENSKTFIVCPSYRVPYVNSIHYSNVGNKLVGAYFGRAYDQMLQGYQPDQLKPLGATRRGNILKIRFDVPHLPLRLGSTELAAVTNHGFQVRDGGTPVTISSVAVDGSDVVITLGATPSGSVTVRYALDYVGSGRPTVEGGGNLRDSAPETITISGTEWQLFNAAPAFEKAVVKLGE